MLIEPRPKILAICGSTRKNSVNEVILNFLKLKFQKKADIEVFTDLATLPHFNPDQTVENIPLVVSNWQSKIESADAVIFCTPEYVFSLPGSLKNSIEWTVGTTVFSGKPVGVIVASGLGEKAFESLLLILKTIEAKVDDSGSILISGARGIIDEKGEIKDEAIVKKLDEMMEGIFESIRSIIVNP